uniref:Uncharacterized protein n=1 Tax=Panagrolaimus sp. ES5 TaxID=591445 RepID=A0AC34GM78_9BILA
MDPFIGQAVFPVDCLRGGYRSVPLLNQSSEPQELAALSIEQQNAKLLNPHNQLQRGRTVKDPQSILQRGRSCSVQSQEYPTPLQSPTSITPPTPRSSIQSESGSQISTSSNSNPDKIER